MPSPTTVVDRVVRACRRCGRELTVAERMFYFLEASEIAPWCRECLADATVVPAAAPLVTSDRGSVQSEPFHRGATPAPSPDAFEGILMDALRMFLAEELRRAGVSLERFPTGEPRIRAALDLHNETRSLLELDRLREAIESLRDLRTIVHAIEGSAARGASPTVFPEDPTIDELYARVLERASLLSARLRADLEATEIEAIGDASPRMAKNPGLSGGRSGIPDESVAKLEVIENVPVGRSVRSASRT